MTGHTEERNVVKVRVFSLRRRRYKKLDIKLNKLFLSPKLTGKFAKTYQSVIYFTGIPFWRETRALLNYS